MWQIIFYQEEIVKAYLVIRMCCGFYDNEHMIRAAMGSDLDGVSVEGKAGTELLADGIKKLVVTELSIMSCCI
jgi:precorrin isomerase